MRGTLLKKGIRKRYEITRIRMVLMGDCMRLILSEVDTYAKSKTMVTLRDAVQLRSSKQVNAYHSIKDTDACV